MVWVWLLIRNFICTKLRISVNFDIQSPLVVLGKENFFLENDLFRFRSITLLQKNSFVEFWTNFIGPWNLLKNNEKLLFKENGINFVCLVVCLCVS